MESITQTEYTNLVWKLTQLEEMTGREYLRTLGAYAIQLELPYAIFE